MGTALEEASGCSSESGIMVLEQKPARKQGAPNRWEPQNKRSTVSASSLTTIAWWPMRGLLLPATLARHSGPGGRLVDVDHLAPRRSAPGTGLEHWGQDADELVASALASAGDCIDDADALRAEWDGRCSRLRGQGAIHPEGPSCARFRWGHVRQSRPRPAGQLYGHRAWAASQAPLTRRLAPDHRPGLDRSASTYGLAKEGARHHGYTGARGYPVPAAGHCRSVMKAR